MKKHVDFTHIADSGATLQEALRVAFDECRRQLGREPKEITFTIGFTSGIRRHEFIFN